MKKFTKNKKKGLMFLGLSLVALLSACGANSSTSGSSATNVNTDDSDSQDIPDEKDTTGEGTAITDETSTTESDEEKISAIPTTATEIKLVDDGTIAGTGYEVDGNEITITSDGSYALTGTLSNGFIVVKKNVFAHLYLNGVSITSLTGSPLIFKKDTTHDYPSVITLVEGSTNTLVDANLATYTSGDLDDDGTYANNATFYAKRSVSVNGTGTLNIKSYYHEGVHIKGDATVLDGNIVVDSYDHGFKGDDNIYFLGGTVDITSSAGDGVKTDEPDEGDAYDASLYNAKFGAVNLTIDAKYDGIQVENSILFDGGVYNITTYGGLKNRSTYEKDYEYDDNGNVVYEDGEAQLVSAKSIKTSYDWTSSMVDGYSSIYVKSGTFVIDAVDDAFNANNALIIDGGTFNIQAGDDGMHADSVFTFNDGTINISLSYEGLEASNMNFVGGTATVYATDDGINASDKHTSVADGQYDSTCQMYFNGSTIYVSAEGDGIDSNGTAQFNAGVVTVEGPTNGGNSAIDTNGGYVINGGTIIAASAVGMVENPKSNGTQYSATLSASITKGTVVKFTDNDGNEITSYTATKNGGCVMLSSNLLKLNGTYKLYLNGTLTTTWTQDSLVFSNVSTQNGMGEGQPGGQGQPGGGRF
jgi:hypothetical protein